MSNETERKGCSFETALAIGIMASIIWLVFIIFMYSLLPIAVATAPLPFLSLLLSGYKQRISGLLTMLFSFIPLVTIPNIPGVSSDSYFGFSMVLAGLFITLPFLISGIGIYNAPTKEERKKLAEVEKRGKILTESEVEETLESDKDRETFSYISTLCPYCGSVNIKSAIVEKADTSEKRKSLGFTKKFLFNCDGCKSTWFAVEK